MATSSVQIVPIKGIPLLKPGDDLAQLIVEHAYKQKFPLCTHDIVVVGQKAVSKTENRIIDIRKIIPTTRALKIARKTGKPAGFVQAVLEESKMVVRADKEALIVRRKDGSTCLNAGIDKSNVSGKDMFILLPEDADQSARKLCLKIRKLTRQNVGVIVSDSRSRPFRFGQVEEAVGLAGVNALVDYRGIKDLYGYSLRFKNVNVADELASAAELVMGQGTEKTPVAIIRGVPRLKYDGRQASRKWLTVSRTEDLFHGTL
jgi:coenzyme F420-0:L-glutamate ligase/coenzyme F420-1:gamma-L-glutamate ligase